MHHRPSQPGPHSPSSTISPNELQSQGKMQLLLVLFLFVFSILFVVNAYQFLKGQSMVNFITKNFLICFFLLISSIRISSSFS